MSLQLIGALEIGLIFGIVSIGIYLTFTVIDFPDLTVDGSFTLGAAVAIILITQGVSPSFATLFAILAAAGAGLVTAFLHNRCKIMGLLAGILTMTALYSINLRIMTVPNISIIDQATLFTGYSIVLVMLLITTVIIFLVALLLATKLGLGLRAVGINKRVSTALGINLCSMNYLALALSNGLVGLAGALFAQMQEFADISMGFGTVIIGLASVIIGQALCSSRSITASLLAVVIGSILYRMVIALALNSDALGLQASDLNLVTASLVVATMVLSNSAKRGKQ